MCIWRGVFYLYIIRQKIKNKNKKKHENRKIKTSNRVTTVNLFVKSGNDHTYVMCENDIKKKKQSSIMPEFIAKWWGRKNRKLYFIKNFDVTLTSTSFINTFATLWVENLKVSKKKKISRSSIGSLITFIVCMVRVDLCEFFYERGKFSSKFSMTLFFIFFSLPLFGFMLIQLEQNEWTWIEY